MKNERLNLAKNYGLIEQLCQSQEHFGIFATTSIVIYDDFQGNLTCFQDKTQQCSFL